MAIYTRLSKKDCSQIAEEFGLGDLVSSTGIRNGSINTHYLLETKKGRFFVKIDEIKSEIETKQEIELILFLKRHGFPCLQPLRSKKGKYYYETQSKQLSVSKYLDGVDSRTATEAFRNLTTERMKRCSEESMRGEKNTTWHGSK